MRVCLRFCLTGLPLVLAACLAAPGERSTSSNAPGSIPNTSGSASLGPSASEAASTPATVWPGGTVLAFGQRYASTARGRSWIVSKPFGLETLTLTSLSLPDGATTTTLVEGQFLDFTGAAGAAADDLGQVWLVYLGQIVRIDEQRGTTHRWNLPPSPPDAAPSEANPAAGQAVADAWDSTNSRLLFVRNGDHRLYRFDPVTASVSSTDLPITTTLLSRVTVAADGSIAVSGSRPGTTGPASATAPATALLAASRQPIALAGVLAACGVSSGMATIDATGALRIPSSARLPVGQLGFVPETDTPFACDPAGDVFSAQTVGGNLVVVRISAAHLRSEVDLPLSPIAGQQPAESAAPSASPGGPSPSPEFADPLLQAILPDGDGGAWLISADGARFGDNRPVYPSLLHVLFSP